MHISLYLPHEVKYMENLMVTRVYRVHKLANLSKDDFNVKVGHFN